MVPAAFVRLDALPLTANDKLDRNALPVPDQSAFARESYEVPQGETESKLATIWEDLLGVDGVGRYDNFFALGGHSLLVVRMLDHLRRHGLTVSVRTVYEVPVLKNLALELRRHLAESIPPNIITSQIKKLTPEMLPLIELSQADIDCIIEQTPGGLTNIQDIYALSPLQDGILFHHLLATKGDPYLLSAQMAFESRALLDRYLQAFQRVVDRHDILRTAFVWKNISIPAQVVWRHAPLPVQELTLDPADGPIMKQLNELFHPNHHRMDLTQAPLFRFMIAQDTNGRWLLFQLVHHLIGDHTAAEILNLEIERILHGQEQTLPKPKPFRNSVARSRLGIKQEVHERFFKDMLGDIDEPTFPFGYSEVHRSGTEITESHQIVPQALNDRLRFQAKQMGVSLASLCHVAWAQVIARTSGQESVVFGTVLFGGVHDNHGADHAMGLSINTLPFRCDIGSQSVLECVRQTHTRLAVLLEHEHASLSLVQRCSGVTPGTPLFSALLNYLHTSLPSGTDPGGSIMEFVSQEEQVHYPGIELLEGRERTNYPFTLTVEDFGTAIGLTSQIIQPIDASRMGGYMKQALESLVGALENSSKLHVSQLEVLPPEEKTLLLYQWNSTTMAYPRQKTIHSLFEDQVERTPQATALVFMDQSLSYSELNARANRLAHHLIGLGVQPDMCVAICVERSFAMIIGVLAILKAGGAYVPLDPMYPKERLISILEDARPRIALVDNVGHAILKDATLSQPSQKDHMEEAPIVLVDMNERRSAPHTNPETPRLTSRHLAYVIYTSGSTGNPKGVMIEHRGFVEYILSRIGDLGLDGSSRVLQFSSLNFDLSAMDIFTAFYSGASLHLLDNHTRLDRSRLWDYIERHSITQAVMPPAILQECKGCPPLSTRLTLVSCGEELQASLLRALCSLIPHGTIINDYGPTESTVIATTWKSPTAFNGHIVPIGRPIANKKIYILDDHGRPVPLGVVGELYIGGVGIARGYLNLPELTVKVFVPDPFTRETDARMYKTGDLARYLPDGNLLFLGRNDHQVKIRGFRVEPGEIEARIVDHSLVDKAAVVAIGEGSDKRLVAYVVAKPDDQLVHSLRSHLSSCLPEYMVPAAIVRLDVLPLTSNNKLDRKALPAPDCTAFARQEYEEPQGDIETRIAHIWAELLGLDRVSRNDNFFALGGHSLLAVQLMERLRRLGLALPLSALFNTPTLSVLAESLSQFQEQMIPSNLITPTTTAITPEILPLISLTQSEIDHIVKQVRGGVANIQDIYPLSPLQEGILFHHLMETKGDLYLLVSCSAFETRQLLDRYLDAAQHVIDRHDILRTGFMWESLSTPVQVVWRQAPLSIMELHFDLTDGPIQDQLMQRLDPRQHRIDLTQAPLLRFTIARNSDGRWLLAELLHHLVGDHSTLEIMNMEIREFIEGRGNTLLAPQPFRNMIAQARLGRSQDDHEKFFTEMLGDIDTPSLPFGLTNIHGQGDDVTTAYLPLPQDLNDRLRRQAKQIGVSVASLCHIAWAQVISRTSGEDRVVFGTVLFGRMQSGPGADSAMGLFINTLPLRVDLNGNILESVLRTHARLASLLEHEHASLVLAQRCSNVPQGTPLFSSILNYRHSTPSSEGTSINPGIEHLQYNERTNYPLLLSVEDFGTGLGLTVNMVRPFDPKRVCGYMQQTLQSLAEALDHAPDILANNLEVLPLEERRLLLHTWNSLAQNYPQHQTIHGLFEDQVKRTPHATALVFMGPSMTYTELNIRSNRLAHHLIELGVRPDMRVAICVERSFAMIIGVLAILKAGGAYLPLDPNYPKERLAYILEDAAPAVALVDATGRTTLEEAKLHLSHQK
ncbi:hypothetical protein BGZ65_003475, partial [Modicella reniformis]